MTPGKEILAFRPLVSSYLLCYWLARRLSKSFNYLQSLYFCAFEGITDVSPHILEICTLKQLNLLNAHILHFVAFLS